MTDMSKYKNVSLTKETYAILEKLSKKNWSGRRDLNPRPQPWQGCALPLSYARSLALPKPYGPVGRRPTSSGPRVPQAEICRFFAQLAGWHLLLHICSAMPTWGG